MQVTLRQAHKLVQKIAARLSTIDISPTRSVNIWDATEVTFSNAEHEFEQNVARSFKLLEARHDLRTLIGKANWHQVDILVGERKMLLDQLGMARAIMTAVEANSDVSSPAALQLKITSLTKSTTSNSLFNNDAITIMVAPQSLTDKCSAMIDQLQLQVEATEDRLTTANGQTILLSDEIVATLQNESILSK